MKVRKKYVFFQSPKLNPINYAEGIISGDVTLEDLILFP